MTPTNQRLFTIEYDGGSGALSRRKVKLLSVENHTQPPMLVAICMRSKAIRNFRLDRIAAIITHCSEERVDPLTYLKDNAQVGSEQMQRPEVPRLAHARYILSRMQAPIAILKLAAAASYRGHYEAQSIIMDHVRRDLRFIVRAGWIEAGDKREELSLLPSLIDSLEVNADDLPYYVGTVMEYETQLRVNVLTENIMRMLAVNDMLSPAAHAFIRDFNHASGGATA